MYRSRLIRLPLCLTTLITLVWVHFSPVPALGQNEEKRSLEAVLEQFKVSINQEFETFKSANDSVFLKYLQDSWTSFQVFSGEQRRKPKPAEQPAVERDSVPPDSVFGQDREHLRETGKKPDPASFQSAGMEMPRYDARSSYINFFGLPVGLPETVNPPRLASPTKEQITAYFRSCSLDPRMDGLIRHIQEMSGEFKLNDWGTFNLVRQVAMHLTPSPNEQKLLTWYILLKSGFNIKSGYNSHTIFLLAETETRIYDVPYVSIGNVRYYILSFHPEEEPFSGLQSYGASYPGGSHPISFVIREYPELITNPCTRHLSWGGNDGAVGLNRYLIDFLGTYPNCELTIYFQAPLSANAKASFDNILAPLLRGKTHKEQVEILLELVQDGIPYRHDLDQFGEENYLFADETLFYPYADCEDRAVLFARLVKQYTGLEVVGLDYPDHVSTAVHFEEPITGEYILVNNQQYYICDPTYIGAKPGMLMECMRNEKPEIIMVK